MRPWIHGNDAIQASVLELAAVDCRRDVGMLQPPERLGLPKEPRLGLVGAKVFMQHLDRKLLAAIDMHGAIDGAEAASATPRLHVIVAGIVTDIGLDCEIEVSARAEPFPYGLRQAARAFSEPGLGKTRRSPWAGLDARDVAIPAAL